MDIMCYTCAKCASLLTLLLDVKKLFRYVFVTTYGYIYVLPEKY